MTPLVLPTLLAALTAAGAAGGTADGPPGPAAGPPADPLAALAAALAPLAAASPVEARVAQHVRFLSSDDAAPRREGTVEGQVSAGPDGLAIRWPRALLDLAAAEERKAAADPESRSPTRDALRTVDPLELASQLDAAAALRLALVGASVVEDRPDQRDGVAVRLLVLTLRVDLPKRDRKYVKEAEATLRLWLGADGLPVAGEQRTFLRGRAFLVIGFESEQTERWRFARTGDRLVALERVRDERSEGGGEKGGRHLVTRLTLGP